MNESDRRRLPASLRSASPTFGQAGWLAAWSGEYPHAEAVSTKLAKERASAVGPPFYADEV